ncbi:MAG TPA: YetF domain-containing protein [Chthoniobacterales bacterium]|jgi:uncharacterized membrane protein YcaP (DUF421 family)
MAQFHDWMAAWLGLGLPPGQLTFAQLSLRGLIVFVSALILVRVSDRRSLTKKSPFAVVLLVVIASVLARAVNGNAPFFATIGAVAVIVFAHRLLAAVVSRWPAFSRMVKGHPVALVRDGKLLRKAMRGESIAEEDVIEDLRLNAKTDEIEKVKSAQLEVSGNVSFIMQDESK